MTATAASLAVPSRAPGALPARRLLGALGMLGAPGSLFFIGGSPSKTDLAANLVMLAYLAGWLCSVVGMRALRASGRGRGAGVLFATQVLLLALAATQQVQDQTLSRPLGDAFYFASDMAWPVSHVLMLALFAAVHGAGVWTGWRRWTPLACGLALPLTFAAAIGGFPWPGLVFGLGTGASFFALGFAVWTAGRAAL